MPNAYIHDLMAVLAQPGEMILFSVLQSRKERFKRSEMAFPKSPLISGRTGMGGLFHH